MYTAKIIKYRLILYP